MFFRLTTWELGLILVAVVLGTMAIGLVLGRYLRHRSEHLREPVSVLQAALLGLVGLVLAFGLALAVGRYEARRTAVVDEANAIGTTYLRAQTLSEPVRSRSLPLLVAYTDAEIRLTDEMSGSELAEETVARASRLQRELWALAGRAVREEPTASAPRLYEDSLNAMIDQQAVRVAGLNNRVPTEVLLLELIGAAGAMFLVGLHVGLLGRSLTPLLLAAGLVAFLLFVNFDLDRPTRGFIKVPDAPLAALRASMDEPPAYGGP